MKDRKMRFVSLRQGYHGDTIGCMSVCDPVNGMHTSFSNFLPQNITIPSPAFGEEQSLSELRKVLSEKRDEVCGLIMEPLVQGAGGMLFHSENYLFEVRKLCDEFDVLLIFDEIATGFGRATGSKGHLFAFQSRDGGSCAPDILCVGKALTGGIMSLGATLCSRKVADMISPTGVEPLMHGPTFMGNPLACAVSSASIDLLLNSPWEQRVKDVESALSQGLQEIRGNSKYDSIIHDVRVLGAIGVVELKKPLLEYLDPFHVQDILLDSGVWLRPFGKLIYTMPIFNHEKTFEKEAESIQKIVNAMEALLKAIVLKMTLC